MTFQAHVNCHTQAGTADALILTTWNVGAPSRTTRIEFSSGATLILDHAAVAAYLIQNNTITHAFGSDGTTPRAEQRYHALYQRWPTDHLLSPDTSRRLHQTLLAPHSTHCESTE